MRRKASIIAVLACAIVLSGFAVLPLRVYADATWNVEVVDAKAEMEAFSLALDSHGAPHLVYCATPSGNSFSHPSPEYLTYASWNGSGWSTQVVDENGYVGYSGLAFDSNDTPHIAYSTNDHIPASANNLTYHYFLRYATWNGTNWSTMTLGSGVSASIAVDSRGNPNIACAGDSGVLKYVSWTGANWTTQTVDPTFLRPQKPNGVLTASQYLALDTNDNPCIVYSNESTVKVAMGSASGWNIQTVLSGEQVQLGNVVVDSNGYPRFTCTLKYRGPLLYESWNGSAWTTQQLGQVSYGQGFVQLDSKGFIQLDSRDTPKITCVSSYPNEETGNYMPTVFYMGWNGTGWDIQMVGQFGYLAGTAPFALDSQGNPHVCYLTGRGTGDQNRFWADGTVMYATSNQPVPTPTPKPTAIPSPTPSPSIPELSSWLILPLMLVTAIAVLAANLKLRKNIGSV